MPFIILAPEPTEEPDLSEMRPLRGSGTSKMGMLESVLVYNGWIGNDKSQIDYFDCKTMDGLSDADMRISADPSVGRHGEDPNELFYSGRPMILNGVIKCYTLDKMRDMEQELETAFAEGVESPMIFDRSQLRTYGLSVMGTTPYNLTQNPKADRHLSGWSRLGTNTIARVVWPVKPPMAVGGTHSVRSTYQNDLRLAQFTGPGPAPTAMVQLSCYVYIPFDWDGGAISIDDDGAHGAGTVWENHPADMNIRGRWQQIWQSEQVAAGPANITAVVRAASAPTAGRQIYITGLMARSHTTNQMPPPPEYNDGDSPGWKWNAEWGDSQSVLDTAAYRQNTYIVCRKTEKIGLRDEQEHGRFHRNFQVPLRASDPRVYALNSKQYTTPLLGSGMIPAETFSTDPFTAKRLVHIPVGDTTGLAVITNELRANTAGAKRFYINTVNQPANGRIWVKHRPVGATTGYELGLMARGVDDETFLMGRITPTTIAIYSVSFGNTETLVSTSTTITALTAGTNYWLSFEIIDNVATLRHHTTSNLNTVTNSVSYTIPSVPGGTYYTTFTSRPRGRWGIAKWVPPTGQTAFIDDLTFDQSNASGYDYTFAVKNNGNFFSRPRIEFLSGMTSAWIENLSVLPGETTPRRVLLRSSVDDTVLTVRDTEGVTYDARTGAATITTTGSGGRTLGTSMQQYLAGSPHELLIGRGTSLLRAVTKGGTVGSTRFRVTMEDVWL